MLAFMRHVVWGWTAFTSVFLWTVTNRGLWRPSISSASIGDEGNGQTITFWIFLSLIPFVLYLFYLRGRQLRFGLRSSMLILWNVAITVASIYIVAFAGGDVQFAGQTWGWKVPLVWIAGVSSLMTILACIVTYLTRVPENNTASQHAPIRWKHLAGFLLVTPIVAALFLLGDGYDWTGRAATALAIIQWIGILVSIEGTSEHNRELERRSRANVG